MLEYPDYVHIFAITKKREVILIRQYRQGIGRTLIELPSGCMDKTDTSPIEAARRELLEETGYTCDKLIKVGTLSPNPSNHANTSHCILALDAEFTGNKPEDLYEQVQVFLTLLEQVKKMLFAGELIQSLYISTMFYSLNYLGELHCS